MVKKNKTKIICTIGPASRSPRILEELFLAGLDIARLNFSHGDFEGHKKDADQIRNIAEKLGKTVVIMADLPGPKIRIGDLVEEHVELQKDQVLILSTKPVAGTREKISVNLPQLPGAVEPGDFIFINDGFIQLQVLEIKSEEIFSKVIVGGILSSRKGLNIPNVDLGISAFTENDKKLVRFAQEIGVDALSQSFVQNAEDVLTVRKFLSEIDYNPFVIAKIERAEAVRNLDSILLEADGIMVARGDLGVEIPMAEIPITQKTIIDKANQLGKPVITATHMLESMIFHRIPTRAEATDVANAILDGTDCVMLSGESAVGKYPVEAVKTLSAIAVRTEESRLQYGHRAKKIHEQNQKSTIIRDIIASSVNTAIKRIRPAVVIVPTRRGLTARNVTRYRFCIWIIAGSSHEKTCRKL